MVTGNPSRIGDLLCSFLASLFWISHQKGREQIFSESEDNKSQFWSKEKPTAIPSLQAKDSALEKCLEVSWQEPNKAGALTLANPKYTISFYITRWLPFTPKQGSELLYSDPSVD